MKISTLSLIAIAVIGAGCTTAPPSAVVSTAELPNCFDSNYSTTDRLFTIKNASATTVNQQCLLTVAPRGKHVAGQQLAAGTYMVSVSDGGGGGAGGTMHDNSVFPGVNHAGGGGGGGAGAQEKKVKLDLAEGTYRIAIGAGGPGGSACSGAPNNFPGGPGWLGSPTNIVRLATGEVLLGTPGAESYARPTRGQNEKMAGTKRDGHGGSGPGMEPGGQGTTFTAAGNIDRPAIAGDASQVKAGGDAGAVLPKDSKSGPGPGGGGGATVRGEGGDGGGDRPGHKAIVAERGALGSGGGGGAGDLYGCGPGARGGHGYVGIRPI